MNSFLLSFIIPCYNVEKFLQQCLDSIYACDLPENQFEVLCINDCSPDNVQEVLERNQRHHDNLRIIVHKNNLGPGGARNTGIREARGKYLWFVDADDFVTAKELKSLAQRINEQELDVLCFNYRRVDLEGRELSIHRVFKETTTLDGYSFVKSVFGKGIVHHMGYVVRFLYCTEHLRLRQLSFPEHVLWEDTVYMPKALLAAERVAAVSDVLYSYRVNVNSITGTFDSAYPAGSIFEFAFCTGSELLRFSEEVSDVELSSAFRDTAIKKYINGFALFLLRTGKSERSQFYQMLKTRKEEWNPIKPYLNWKSRVMLMPVVGPMATDVLSIWYKKTHSRKHV